MCGNSKTDMLLAGLKQDSEEYKNLRTDGVSLAEKKNMIRSLMNIRMPRAVSAELLAVQDDYLQEELDAKGVVTWSEIPTVAEQYDSCLSTECASRISIWQGDITRLQTGAIVNAANSRMLGCFVPCHRCIDNAIHSAAGIQLRMECDRVMQEKRMRLGREYEEPTGTAVLTRAYNLPCDYVIHTVGPIVHDKLNDSLRQDLQNCYESVLQCCVEHGIRSVAFCCISTGEFHFPAEEAAKIAVKTVNDFLKFHKDAMDRVIFNVFKDSDLAIYQKEI